jgi:hypothetical protein
MIGGLIEVVIGGLTGIKINYKKMLEHTIEHTIEHTTNIFNDKIEI